MVLFAFLGGFYPLDGLKCIIHDQGAINGDLFMHKVELHRIVSVKITQ
jgi:hypothetical protein